MPHTKSTHSKSFFQHLIVNQRVVGSSPTSPALIYSWESSSAGRVYGKCSFYIIPGWQSGRMHWLCNPVHMTRRFESDFRIYAPSRAFRQDVCVTLLSGDFRMCSIGEQKRVLTAFISLSVITKLLYSQEWIRKCPLFSSRLLREYEANTGDVAEVSIIK